MKFNKQKFKHDPLNGMIGDCHRTAIACILNLEPEQVPHYIEQYWNQENGGELADKAFNKWLLERNLEITDIAFNCSLEEILNMKNHYSPNAYYILSGQSRNGTNHTVVAKGGEIIWDPAIDNSGILGPCHDGLYWVGYIVPIEYGLTIDQDARINGIVSDLETLCTGINIGTREALFAAQIIDLTHSVKKRLEALWEELSCTK